MGDMAGVGLALENMGFTKELSPAQVRLPPNRPYTAPCMARAPLTARASPPRPSPRTQSAAFAKDLQEVFSSVDSMTAGAATGGGLAGGGVDETQLNRAVAAVGKVAEGYGIRFPREFALLIKQVLYFDRYTSILAPGLDVLNDERLSMNAPPPGSIPGSADDVAGRVVGSMPMTEESVKVEVEVLPPVE